MQTDKRPRPLTGPDHRQSSMTRRRLCLGGCAAMLTRPALAAFAWPNSGKVICAVTRAGSRIGQAAYSFDRQGDALSVDIAVDIRVRIGFITVFRFAHQNTERWQGDQLLQFDAHTDDNGRSRWARARWNGAALDVTGSQTTPYTAPPKALGTSYWNPRTLVDPLISTQHGALLKVRLSDQGPSKAVMLNGQTVDAIEYRMTGEMRMNLWYDHADNLAGLQYYAHDGSIVTYEKA